MATVKQKALAKNRKPANEDVDYKAMLDEDRMEDPNQKKEVNANTDDEGNPLAEKKTISMAGHSKQYYSDAEEYEQKTALPKRIREKALAEKRNKK